MTEAAWAPNAPTGQTPYFHVGILVADLDAAIRRFSQVLGLRFGPVSDTQTPVDSGTITVEHIRPTYSVDGPPYTELIEGSGDGLFSLQNGEGLHHLGIWSPHEFDDYNRRAVNEPDLSGDMGALVVIRQERHDIGALAGLADPALRDLGGEEVQEILRGVIENRRACHTRSDCVHANSLLGVLERPAR